MIFFTQISAAQKYHSVHLFTSTFKNENTGLSEYFSNRIDKISVVFQEL